MPFTSPDCTGVTCNPQPDARRRPESAVRAYLTVIDRNPEAVEKALMNKS
jgi:hypothetical protein